MAADASDLNLKWNVVARRYALVNNHVDLPDPVHEPRGCATVDDLALDTAHEDTDIRESR